MAPAFGDLEFELTRLARRSRSNQARIAAEVHPDLDVAGYAVLVTIRDLGGDGNPGRATEIGEFLGLHKSTMSRNLSTLERLGLVERLPDPEDARAIADSVIVVAEGRAAPPVPTGTLLADPPPALRAYLGGG